MVKYLARLGHSVTVLSSTVSGAGTIEGAAEVIRTRDLLVSSLNWRKRHFEALTRGEGAYRPASRLQSLVVPDLALVSWLPFAWAAALEVTRARTFDCVITTSPPQSAHMVGAQLRKRRLLPWIAELRDGWTFEPPHPPWPLGAQRALDERLERRLLCHADEVVAATEPIVADLRARLGLAAVRITNGFDPDELSTRATNRDDPLLDPARHSFVHTGRIAIGGASARPLLEAVDLIRSDARAASRLEVVLAGPLSAEELELVGHRQSDGLVRVVGTLEHARAVQLQRAADTLLVVTEGSRRRSVATGKLFEYLAAGKPILVLGDGTEAARIVAETGTGTATSATDPATIARALTEAAEAHPPDRDKAALERYSWSALAERYAELIERVAN